MSYPGQWQAGNLPITITPPTDKRVILRYVKSAGSVTVSQDAALLYVVSPEDVFPGNMPVPLDINAELVLTGTGHVFVQYETE